MALKILNWKRWDDFMYQIQGQNQTLTENTDKQQRPDETGISGLMFPSYHPFWQQYSFPVFFSQGNHQFR